MKFKPIFSVVLPICGVLVACGGGEKPAVEPAPVAAPVVADSSKPDLSNAVDRYSYALGMDLGKAVANVNVPLNIPVLMGAIKDQVDSNRSVLMSDSASESALQDLLLQMQKKKEADDKAQAQKALDEQTKFFAENAKDTTVKKTPKGVQYKMLKAGAGISPKTGDKVQVHYVGSLLDGTEFDNSVKRGEPLEFPVDAVIEGWQDLLQVMKEGDKVKAWIPSALAYGEAGALAFPSKITVKKIPGNKYRQIVSVELGPIPRFDKTPAVIERYWEEHYGNGSPAYSEFSDLGSDEF